MRTLIRGGWVVAFGGATHALIRNGVVAYEGNRIIHVGAAFEGAVDATIDASGKLVMPGFVDVHVHSGDRAGHRLICDGGRPEYFGTPILDAGVRGRTHAPAPPSAERLELEATFTVAELLRNGITTFVEFGAHIGMQDAILAQVERFGIRSYLGPGFYCGEWEADAEGRLVRELDEATGERTFRAALEYLARIDGRAQGRVRGILVPRSVEACTPALLRRAREAADERKLPFATHAAYSVLEFHDVVRRYRMTPIEVLESVGLLRPTLNIGHGNFIADNPNLNYSGGRDLALMGGARVTVSHCPLNIIRRARTLDTWERYRNAGVNLALGTDTYPRDMIMNMRAASYLGKVTSRNLLTASAGQVFEAATLGGSRALGRDDLGRLAPGALADIVIVDLSRRDVLRHAPSFDPVKTLVECGIGDDVSTVIVDGVTRLSDGRIEGFDIGALRDQVQAAAEASWSSWSATDFFGRRAEEISPPSFPRLGGP
ncbi:MAG: ethylammeline chlorohydrolase [Betaproteobacteria bacterium]|nr:ethylammeline chlorohydrolase [Betaproteobacteria bacterium]